MSPASADASRSRRHAAVDTLETDEARQHAPLGGAMGSEPRLRQAEVAEVVGELAVQEARGIGAAHADQPGVREPRGTLGRAGINE